MRCILITIFATICLISCTDKSTEKISKELKSEWEFKANDTLSWNQAKVPGCVHTDLLNNKLIEDPYYRMNEYDLQWIDKHDWIYRTTFSVDKDLFSRQHIRMLFKGLDTHADVYLNDSLILKTDNMFREWAVNVKSILNEKDNHLKIYFHSAVKRGLEKYKSLDYVIPASDNDFSEVGGLGDKRVSIFNRKAMFHFGWDWGPRFVTSGVWKPIYIEAWEQAEIKEIDIHQKQLTAQNAEMNTELVIYNDDEAFDCKLKLYINDDLENEKTVKLKNGKNTLDFPFNINEPELWWPNGMGDQHMYNIKISLENKQNTLDKVEKRIGLRTIEIIQEPDSVGSNFLVEVNGIQTFMKGANYIPQDVFLNRVSVDEYEHVLETARESNMNMIRVWGGGIYEKDIFYDLCDEKGLLVWQDFMFACAMFPGDTAYLNNVSEEAEDNIKRLRHHPSIALWCGNNEILSAWFNWGWKDKAIEEYGKETADVIWKAYTDIFHKVLPAAVEKNDSDRFYWSSSPSVSMGVPENWKSGDTHYWGVWWGQEPFSTYAELIPRFMSEFGFQSFPSFSTVKKYTIPEDWDIYSDVMKAHQKSSIGNKTIAEYLSRDFKEPKDFKAFLYVGQLLQAEGMKTGFEAHRRNKPYCMGSLYWQLNDCWPVASWSGMDYYGKWKALQYYTKRAFSDVLVSPYIENNRMNIYIVSDLLEDKKAELSLKLRRFDGEILWDYTKEIIIPANESKIHYGTPLNDLVKGYDTDEIVLTAELMNENKVFSKNTIYFKPFKELNLPAANVSTTMVNHKDGIEITVSTDAFAKGIYLSSETEGHFSDNYFDLMPDEEKVVVFTPDDKSLTEITDLQATSLVESY